VEIETGKVVQRLRRRQQYFAEGLAAWGTQLIQLTWETNIGFVYDRATFKQLRPSPTRARAGAWPTTARGW
jgi:glutaminyl-peptide cyclotransferase